MALQLESGESPSVPARLVLPCRARRRGVGATIRTTAAPHRPCAGGVLCIFFVVDMSHMVFGGCVCLWVCVCVRACVRACVRVCVSVCIFYNWAVSGPEYSVHDREPRGRGARAERPAARAVVAVSSGAPVPAEHHRHPLRTTGDTLRRRRAVVGRACEQANRHPRVPAAIHCSPCARVPTQLLSRTHACVMYACARAHAHPDASEGGISEQSCPSSTVRRLQRCGTCRCSMRWRGSSASSRSCFRSSQALLPTKARRCSRRTGQGPNQRSRR